MNATVNSVSYDMNALMLESMIVERPPEKAFDLLLDVVCHTDPEKSLGKTARFLCASLAEQYANNTELSEKFSSLAAFGENKDEVHAADEIVEDYLCRLGNAESEHDAGYGSGLVYVGMEWV